MLSFDEWPQRSTCCHFSCLSFSKLKFSSPQIHIGARHIFTTSTNFLVNFMLLLHLFYFHFLVFALTTLFYFYLQLYDVEQKYPQRKRTSIRLKNVRDSKTSRVFWLPFTNLFCLFMCLHCFYFLLLFSLLTLPDLFLFL